MSCASTTCSSLVSIDRSARPDTLARPWPEPLRSALAYIARLRARSGQRRTLSELDDHLLADIGVSREQALREACKFFWQ